MEEMTKQTAKILNDPTIKYEPVMPFTTDGTAKAVMRLFGRGLN
jgi:hypothetical protein